MPVVVTLPHPIVGFSAEYGRDGQKITVQTSGFVTSEDGDRLVELLDQISDTWLAKAPKRPRESSIDHIVIVCRRDGTAQVYVNEVAMQAWVSVKAARVLAGEAVERDAVADIHRMVLEGVDVPPDAGVLVMLSAGWRRGVLYDFTPLAPDGRPRQQVEFERWLASAWTYLLFQDRVGLTNDDWDTFAMNGWFPFIGLPTTRIKKMRHHGRARWSMDELLPEILGDIRVNLTRLRQQVEAGWLFEGHRGVVLKALSHFEQGDWISATSMLYPRVEGLLRAQHARVAAGKKPTQQALAASAAADPSDKRHDFSLLLPSRFEAYLNDVYFAHFDPKAPAGVSRNTVGHGVAPEADLGEKAAAIGVLIVEQLAFLCAADPSPSDQGTPATSAA